MRLTYVMVSMGVALVAVVPSRSSAQMAVTDPSRPVITTSGSATIHIPPDRASVMITVESHAATASAAAGLNATATASTLAALRAAGLAESQLTTTGFTVSIDYRRVAFTSVLQSAPGAATAPPLEFLASNGVRADIHALGMLSKVIDAALAGGASQIGQVQFTSTAVEQARRTALTQAVANCRADAEAIARAAGGSLGALIEISSAGGATYYGYAPSVIGGSAQAQIRGASVMTAPPPPTQLAPGDVPVSANVTSRWSFVPGHPN